MRFKDMRQGFETIFFHQKKILPPRPKGGKLKHICAMVLLQDFVTFWREKKIWRKKNIFFVEKICQFFEEKKNIIKKKNEKTFFLWKK